MAPSCKGGMEVALVGQTSLDGQAYRWRDLGGQLASSGCRVKFVTLSGDDGGEGKKELRRMMEGVGVEWVEVRTPEVGGGGIKEQGVDCGVPGGLARVCPRDRVTSYMVRERRRKEAQGDWGGEVEDWVKEVWEAMEEPFRGADAVLVANTGYHQDKIIVEAARLNAGVVGMDLANLSPPLGAGVDFFVSPSRGVRYGKGVELGRITSRGGGGYVVPLDLGEDEVICRAEKEGECRGEKEDNGGDAEEMKRVIQSHLTSLSCHSNCLKLVHVGRLSPEKNPTYLLSSFGHLVRTMNKEAVLFIVGGGNMLRPLKLVAEEILGPELHRRVVWLGRVPREVVPTILEGMDAFVNPNLNPEETFCLANVEAMYEGLPLVSHGYGGVGDYLVSGVNGVRVEEVGVEEFGRGMWVKGAWSWGEGGREGVRRLYGGKKQGKEMEGVFREMLAGGGGRKTCKVSRVKYERVEFWDRGRSNATAAVEVECEGLRMGCEEATAFAVCGDDEICKGRVKEALAEACTGGVEGRRVAEVDFGDACFGFEVDLSSVGYGVEGIRLCPWDDDLDGLVMGWCERFGLGGEICGTVMEQIGGTLQWNRYSEWVGGMFLSAGEGWMELW